jgi:hypothetical protein
MEMEGAAEVVEAVEVLPVGSAEAEQVTRQDSSSVNEAVVAEDTGWDACSVRAVDHWGL